MLTGIRNSCLLSTTVQTMDFRTNLPTSSAGKLLKRSLKEEYKNSSQEMEKYRKLQK
jgi:hypothetical protein